MLEKARSRPTEVWRDTPVPAEEELRICAGDSVMEASQSGRYGKVAPPETEQNSRGSCYERLRLHEIKSSD
ncbi:hypothetical protein J437_LFUL000883 [Ladona fulva]|uniref:Uncharacterized protein n=1 Tax=Ladona fulva TaxID=123851 RepID=A0A8K0P1Y0_LADFU|nr:hypothetical protein J437_LFUL000883 [Ladona fulva]